jgi:hypothetical protein
MSLVSTVRVKQGKTELPYINDEYVYNITAEGWQVVRPSFLFFLNSHLPKQGGVFNVAEVGVAGGVNAMIMLKASDRIHLTLVDDYSFGQTPESMLSLTEPYKDRVKFINKTSLEAAQEFPDNHFDYVYIDASHDYQSVLEDLKAWYPKVKLGWGMFAGHDWNKEGVRKAMQEFLKDNPQRLFGIENYINIDGCLDLEEQQGCDWWFTKRAFTKK